MDWQPIETAPKNRRWWLIWDDRYEEPIVVRCRANDGTFHAGDWEAEVKATRWFDLPEAMQGE